MKQLSERRLTNWNAIHWSAEKKAFVGSMSTDFCYSMYDTNLSMLTLACENSSSSKIEKKTWLRPHPSHSQAKSSLTKSKHVRKQLWRNNVRAKQLWRRNVQAILRIWGLVPVKILRIKLFFTVVPSLCSETGIVLFLSGRLEWELGIWTSAPWQLVHE